MDDSGVGQSDQYNPGVAITRYRGRSVCNVVREDTRDGDSGIYMASRALP